MSRNALVIGSGIAGMASAIRLRSKGWSVDVYEANEGPGGKLTQFSSAGYRFDAGPSLFTLPHLLKEVLSCAGESFSDAFRYEKMDEACRYFWSDGTRLTAWSDPADFAQEVEDKLGEPRHKVLDYLKECADLNHHTEDVFLRSSLHKLSTYLHPDILSMVKSLPKLHLGKSLHELNAKRFHSQKLIQFFDRFATYNGSDPYRTPGVMQVIPHLEHNVGTFFPKGGMYGITESLHGAAEKSGVQFHFSQPVEEIVVERKRVQGIRVNGRFVPADLLVTNADVHSTYRNLMPREKAPQKILAQERSSSALIFYWGVKKEFPELGLHNIFFSEDYKEEFRAIFQERTVGAAPTIYVNVSSKYNPADAPKGCESWFVMINVPGDHGQDWAAITDRLRQYIIDRLSAELNCSLKELIEVEELLDPPTIQKRTSSFRGSLYGSGSNDIWSALLRHPNFHRRIENLYFAGGSAHPGGGIPLCMLSAEITAELIEKDHPLD